MEQNKQIIILLENMKKQKELLHTQINLGIIDEDGARDEFSMISKKERELHERLVFSNHVTADGTPRSISHHEPTDSNPKDYYSTKMPDGRKLKAATYEALIDKLFCYYADGISDFSVRSVFNAALLEKEVTENPKQNTIERNRAEFIKFISSDLASKDIRTITENDLKKYIQDWVNREYPKKQAYLSMKGILNLIFCYAHAHRIIPENPVAFIKNKIYLKSCDTKKAKPEEKILSPEEIQILRDEVRHRMTLAKYGSYYINGYALLFAIETGVRVGELCALKWEDVKENSIHIHCQQLYRKCEGGKDYYLVPYTKNEKGQSADGREFPLTRKIREILAELKGKQMELGIQSEFIFCHEDGDWIKTDAYITFLRRLCQSKNFKVTNNHALRMSLNSNVLIPKGVSVADRAAMLGHSIETNLKNYSFAQKDYLDNVRTLLDSLDD
ncbi:MAG: tyrosine-type recombinase/integrase, partial [Parasporobacterium sp.]|nr:tyrosine-type recombinase/integrase [Parasporobacterium sp.]